MRRFFGLLTILAILAFSSGCDKDPKPYVTKIITHKCEVGMIPDRPEWGDPQRKMMVLKGYGKNIETGKIEQIEERTYFVSNGSSAVQETVNWIPLKTYVLTLEEMLKWVKENCEEISEDKKRE